MKTSIQSKLLVMCVLLVVLTTIGISVTYYVLIRQDKYREFQQRIQIAFDIILDDFEARLANLTNRVEVFLSDETLAITSSRYAEDEERISSISFVSTNLAKAAAELKRFGHVNSAQQVVLYGANKRLLASYQHNEEYESTGVYVVISSENDAYLPADDPAQLTPMLLGREDIPDASVPEGISALYEGNIPETVSAQLFTQQNRLGIRVVAPVNYREDVVGFLLVDFYYTQSIVERYASLSQTEVNLFVAELFSVGTLPVQRSLEITSLMTCHDLVSQDTEKEILPLVFDKHDYYQLQCGFNDEQGVIGALTISLSQEIETQAIKKILVAVLLISGVVFGITVALSWIFSRRIIRPITRIATLIHQISGGDLTNVFENEESGKSENNVFGDGEISLQTPSRSDGGEKDEVTILTHSFYAMAEYLRGMTIIANKISHGDITQTISPRSERDLLGNAFRQMLTYIQDITALTKTLSDGDLLVDVQPRSDQDLLSHSLQKMILYIQGVANVAETIADGNLQVHVHPKSEQDILNQSLQKMVRYIQDVANITEKISHNDLQVDVMPKSEHDILNMSLQRMVTNLRIAKEKAEKSITEIERQNWLKTGQAELNDTMRGEQPIAMLAKHVITYLAEYLQAQVGLIYLVEEKHGEFVLQLSGSYAYTMRQGHRNEFNFGEGLVGQAALERESLLFSDIPEGYISILSGIGEMTPRHILVMPFMYEEEVKGVIELGTLHTFIPRHREFLDMAGKNIAIAFHTAQSRVKMQHLLEETQRQSEVLQTQQEELRRSNTELEARTQALQASETKLQAQQEKLQQSNEELRAQAEALKASEEKLQVQQEELRQTNEELEEKTRELEKQRKVLQDKNMALEQSRQLIEEKVRELELTNKYKSEFLANMSHELRTPLNSILILSKLFRENKEGNLTEKQKTSAEMMYNAVMNWIAMIDDVLALSELDSGKFILHIEEVEIRELAAFIERYAKENVKEKGLSFDIDVADGVPVFIQSDQKRIEQIIGNLLSNAIKFTEEGGITIHIDQSVSEDALLIAVSDTGIGISEEQQASIFEAFHQADGTTTRKYGGAGLGLSLSQQLASMLGGKIYVHSEEGKGSTFTLDLPRQGQGPEQETNEGEYEDYVGKQSVKTRQRVTKEVGNVLIVGNNETLQGSIPERLRNEELTVVNITTVQDAYAYLLHEACDCIIIDIEFTGLSGITFLEQTIQNTPKGQIPIVIYTGKELSKDEEMKLHAYTESIIIKGERSQDRLVDEVIRLINQSQSILSSPTQHDVQIIPNQEVELNGKTLLIVDDDIRNLYALTNALDEHGINVVMATNGEEALERLDGHPEIALVLMDIMMPEMDGYEAMLTIREQQTYRQLPIIALTAKAMKGDREKCLEAGANDYLSKPVDLSKLLSLLRVWLTN